jgi:hypothetical protein
VEHDFQGPIGGRAQADPSFLYVQLCYESLHAIGYLQVAGHRPDTRKEGIKSSSLSGTREERKGGHGKGGTEAAVMIWQTTMTRSMEMDFWKVQFRPMRLGI